MVNVYTKNGQFNITESLMRAIKDNQPEILLEHKKEILLEDDKTREMLQKKYLEDILKKSAANVFSDKNIIKLSKGSDEDKELAGELKKYRSQIKKDGKVGIDYEKLYNLYKGGNPNFKKIKNLLDEPYKNLSSNEKKENFFNFINKVIPDMSKSFSHYFTGNEEAAKDFENDIRAKMAHMDFNGTVEDLYGFIHDIDKQIEDEEEEIKQREKLEKGINDADDQILFQQLVKHGLKNLPKTLEVDGVTLTKEEMEKRIKNNPELSKVWNEYKKSSKNTKLAKQYSDKIKSAEKNLKQLNQHVDPKTLEELLNSQRLINEINSIERSARILIKKAERVIPRTLGLFSSSSHNAGSDAKLQNRTTQTVDQRIANDNNQNKPQTQKQNVVNEDVANDNNQSNKNIQVMNDTKPTPANPWSGFKNFGRLAMGGMVLEPLFNGDPGSKEYYGKALRAYKSYMTEKNTDSLVDDMIGHVIELHSNKDGYINKLKSESNYNDEKISELIQKLDEVAASFLGNVVFSLKVGNDKNFNDIVRAIRFSELREMYRISNEGTVQMLNAKEQNIVFTQENNVIVGIFIATPILQITRELINKASGLMNSFRKAKA